MVESARFDRSIDTSKDIFTFNVPREFLWDEITKDVRDLPERLATGISEVSKRNIELQGVIDRVDFLEFARNQSIDRTLISSTLEVLG